MWRESTLHFASRAGLSMVLAVALTAVNCSLPARQVTASAPSAAPVVVTITAGGLTELAAAAPR